MNGRPPIRFLGTCLVFLISSCFYREPEVVIVNKIGEQVLIRNPSFNGTVWNTVLKYGEATSPRECLPGRDRAHFQKFDPYTYSRTQVEYDLLDSLCFCDSIEIVLKDSSVISATPLWFNYQTVSEKRASRGDFLVVEITSGNIEQDFSAAGPYGH